MQSKHNKQLVPFSKQLRKEMTKEERHLWYDFLRSYSVRFSRQKVLGEYIADFYSAEAKIVKSLMVLSTMKKRTWIRMQSVRFSGRLWTTVSADSE